VATALPIAISATPAAADPPGVDPVVLVCDDGNSYETVARAGQDWNAQLDSASNSVFHLTWYSITYVVTEADGTVNVFGPDELVKGGNDRSHKNLLDCTFSFDVDLGDGRSAHIFGPAQGWLTP
jgi:hypothetical protein